MAKRVYVRYINGAWRPCPKPLITSANACGRIETTNDAGHFHSFDDKPSIEEDSGQCEWHHNGQLHRDGDKPALINHNSEIWYQHGARHRENNLPASISKLWGEEWFKMGIRHRDDGGPAIIRPNGNKEWWVNGQINQDDDHFSYHDVSTNTKYWMKEGVKQRDNDLPAIIGPMTSFWMHNDKIHRDGIRPAMILTLSGNNQSRIIPPRDYYYKHGNEIPLEKLVLMGKKILRFIKHAVLRLKLFKLVTRKRICDSIRSCRHYP